MSKEELIAWLDRPPSNNDLDIISNIINLQERTNKAKNNLEKSIESINNKLADKELRNANDRIEYLSNECRIARLKAIRTKCKEILEILGGKEC